MLLSQHVFEGVKARRNHSSSTANSGITIQNTNDESFDDSSSKLYRFVDSEKSGDMDGDARDDGPETRKEEDAMSTNGDYIMCDDQPRSRYM